MAGDASSARLQEIRDELERARTPEQRLQARRALIAELPEDAQAHYKYGRELSRTGNHDSEAITELRQALVLDPNHAAARLALGVVYHRRGQHELAEAMYISAVEAEPRLVRAWLNLGMALEPNTWYRLHCVADFGNRKYVSFTVEGPGIKKTLDLSHLHLDYPNMIPFSARGLTEYVWSMNMD